MTLDYPKVLAENQGQVALNIKHPANMQPCISAYKPYCTDNVYKYF